MTTDHTLKGKPLSEATIEELRAEWNEEMWTDVHEGVIEMPTEEQTAKLTAIERELKKRLA